MTNQKPKGHLKEWLDQLQQQSWQLELLISGFATVLLIGLNQPLNDLIGLVQRITFASDQYGLLFIPVSALKGAWFTLLINLVVHVSLRGLWIAAIGLRYVSEDIDFEQLRLAPKFDGFLKRNLGSFDDFIERLERICSVIFAFSFIIVFIILSLSFFFFTVSIFERAVIDKIMANYQPIGPIIGTIFYVLIVIGTSLYFFDFLSLGRIKRIRWLAPFYFPFYRVMGWLTLANLYRPIYYNLVDHKFGRRVGLLIIPYILLAMFASSLQIQTGKFFPLSLENRIGHSFYDDLSEGQSVNNTSSVFLPSIPSRFVDNGFLEIFIPYVGILDHPALAEVCPNLQEAKKERIFLKGVINIDFSDAPTYQMDSILFCFSELHRIKIDGEKIQNLDYWIYQHPQKKVPGFLLNVDIDSLDRGQHLLSIEQYRIGVSRGSTIGKLNWQGPLEIPIWKE